MNFFTYLKTLMAVLPSLLSIASALQVSVGVVLSTVINMMHGLEKELPTAGKGAEKLQIIKDVIGHAFEVAGKSVEQFQANWPLIESAVGAVVMAFNFAGIFKKSNTPSA